MDNLEFLQWMKRYYDINYNGEGYDAVGRRKGQDLFYILGGGKVGGSGGTKADVKPKSTASSGASKIGAGAKPKAAVTAAVAGKKSAEAGANADVKQLQSELSEAKLNMDTLEKERDFYFGKLRDIEMLMQANPTL